MKDLIYTIREAYVRNHLPNRTWTFEVSLRRDIKGRTRGLLWIAYRKARPNLRVFGETLRTLKYNIHRAVALEATHGSDPRDGGFTDVSKLHEETNS